MKKIFLILIFVTATFTACKKDSTENEPLITVLPTETTLSITTQLDSQIEQIWLDHSKDIKIISDGKEYILFSNVTAGWTEDISGSGGALLLEDIAHRLSIIPYSNNFYIDVIITPDNNNINYILYDENFEELYEQTFFTPPSQSGIYYLVISAAWTNIKGNGSAYQFFVKLAID